MSAILISSSSAAMAETPQQIAETHFKAGLKLYNQENFEAARLELLQAQAVFPRPSVLRNLALCELKTNRPLDALQHLRAYLADPAADARDYAKKNLDEAYARTGHVTVRATEGATLSVDGHVQGNAPFKEPVDMLAGKHLLEVRLGERSAKRDVDAAAGAVVEADLRFADERAVSLAPAAPPATNPGATSHDMVAPPPASERSFWTARHTVGVAVGGLAIVAAGVGGGFLLARSGHVSDGKDALAASSSPCAQPSDPACAKYDGARDGIKSTELGAGLSFGAFAVLGVTAALLIFWPEPKHEARLRFLPVGRDLSVLGTF